MVSWMGEKVYNGTGETLYFLFISYLLILLLVLLTCGHKAQYQIIFWLETAHGLVHDIEQRGHSESLSFTSAAPWKTGLKRAADQRHRSSSRSCPLKRRRRGSAAQVLESRGRRTLSRATCSLQLTDSKPRRPAASSQRTITLGTRLVEMCCPSPGFGIGPRPTERTQADPHTSFPGTSLSSQASLHSHL
ncbi:hypothetical protein BC830DRAFT_695625 [Chytriomyces sp. MP71]|nr:hypothetical protein BC830DRAFT_695625 [Chytriomyces sp. MP71]